MTEYELKWIPRDAPLPKGWEETPQRPTHHHYWSRLVQRHIHVEAERKRAGAA